MQIREVATLTSKGQLTLPKSIRQALGVTTGGKVAFDLQGDVEISDQAIFGDVSTTIGAALERCHARSPKRTGIASTAFEIALDQLV